VWIYRRQYIYYHWSRTHLHRSRLIDNARRQNSDIMEYNIALRRLVLSWRNWTIGTRRGRRRSATANKTWRVHVHQRLRGTLAGGHIASMAVEFAIVILLPFLTLKVWMLEYSLFIRKQHQQFLHFTVECTLAYDIAAFVSAFVSLNIVSHKFSLISVE